MSDNEHRSRLHIHLGGLFVLIIIFLLLFKVDIPSAINSPRFQKNISYIKYQSVNIWDNYLSKPLTNSWDKLFNSLVDKGINKIKKDGLNFKLPNFNNTNPTPIVNSFKKIN